MSSKKQMRIRDFLSLSVSLYLLVVVMIFICETADARVGGGHSYSVGSGGSGGGGGSGNLVVFFFRLIILCFKYPALGIPMLIAFAVIAYLVYQKGDDVYVGHTIQKGTRLYSDVANQSSLSKIVAKDPGFNKEVFFTRIKKAFMLIQSSWERRDLSKAEAFIADGTYEQLQIQINGYKEKKIIDKMEGLEVLSSSILGYESDGRFDSIFVAITAKGKNYRVDERTGRFIEGDRIATEFSEVWTFLRRTGTKTLGKPGLIEGFCPNCGSPISMGRHAKCSSCGSILRSGEHDWVLSNITQASEWSTKTSNRSIPGYSRYLKKDSGFNVQHIEDLVSIMFWRKNEAERIGKADPLRKVATDEFCEAQTVWYKPDANGNRKLYDDCAVGAIQVIAIDDVSSEEEDYILASIVWSGVPSKKGHDGKIVAVVQKTNQRSVFVLKRKRGVRTDTKTTLTSGHCPNCGAPESHSDSNCCEYCGSVMNDGKKDWVLEAVLSSFDSKVSQILSLVKDADREGIGGFVHSANVDDNVNYSKRNYTSEDYTASVYSVPASTMVKWMIAMMLADGQIDSKEIALIYDLGDKRGISRDEIDLMVSDIKCQSSPVDYITNSTSVPMDEELMRVIIRVAYADGKLAKGEIALLRYLGKKMQMSEERMKVLLSEERMNLYYMSKAVIKESKSYQ